MRMGIRARQCCRVALTTGLTLVGIRVGLGLFPSGPTALKTLTTVRVAPLPPPRIPLRPDQQQALNDALLAAVAPQAEPVKNQQQNIERIASLLDQGADPNARNEVGTSALMVTSSNEDPQTVALLLQHRAKPNATDHEGRTALMAAATYGLSEGDFSDFVSQGDISKRYPIVEVMTLLLEQGADPNQADRDGMTALMLTAEYAQCARCVALLLRYGARVDARTPAGISVLRFARCHTESWPEQDNHEVISLLQQAGAAE